MFYFFHPSDALTREELLQKILATRLSPAQRAQCLAEVAARGLAWPDPFREMAAERDATMADPLMSQDLE